MITKKWPALRMARFAVVVRLLVLGAGPVFLPTCSESDSAPPVQAASEGTRIATPAEQFLQWWPARSTTAAPTPATAPAPAAAPAPPASPAVPEPVLRGPPLSAGIAAALAPPPLRQQEAAAPPPPQPEAPPAKPPAAALSPQEARQEFYDGVMLTYSFDACGLPLLGQAAREDIVRRIQACPNPDARKAEFRGIYDRAIADAQRDLRKTLSEAQIVCPDRRVFLRNVMAHASELRFDPAQPPDCRLLSPAN